MSDLKSILNSGAGKELKEFLILEYEKMKNISNIKDFSSAQEQALEFKAQKKAVEKVKDIIGKLISMEELDNPEKENYYNL